MYDANLQILCQAANCKCGTALFVIGRWAYHWHHGDMSHIGKKPIELPTGVTVERSGRVLRVSGPQGTLSRTLRPEVAVSVEGNVVVVRPVEESRRTAAYWGMTRALIAGMVAGVSRGFEKKLEIEGIGYRVLSSGASPAGNAQLQLSLGFSHPVTVEAPPGIRFSVEKNIITIAGIDPEVVGDVAARIRSLKPPEPYKGKGIHYLGEVIRRKVGKKAVTTGT